MEHLDSALRNRYRNRVLQVTKRIYCRHQGSNLRLRGNIAITTDCVRCELDSGLEEGNLIDVLVTITMLNLVMATTMDATVELRHLQGKVDQLSYKQNNAFVQPN